MSPPSGCHLLGVARCVRGLRLADALGRTVSRKLDCAKSIRTRNRRGDRKRIGHPVYPAADKVVFFDPDGELRIVQYNLVNEAVESGGHRAVPMVLPPATRSGSVLDQAVAQIQQAQTWQLDDKSFGYIPDNRVSEAAKSGFQVVSFPDGFILGSKGIDDGIPYRYLRRHPEWWQLLLELYGVVLLSTIAFSYTLQSGLQGVCVRRAWQPGQGHADSSLVPTRLSVPQPSHYQLSTPNV